MKTLFLVTPEICLDAAGNLGKMVYSTIQSLEETVAGAFSGAWETRGRPPDRKIWATQCCGTRLSIRALIVGAPGALIAVARFDGTSLAHDL